MNSNKIAALVITFNPDIERLKQNIHSIQSQVDEVLIVDNGSENAVVITSLIERYTNIKVLNLHANLGIASALNIGMDTLMCKHYEWVLTLDQDSISPQNMVSSFCRYKGDGKVGIISPAINYSDDEIDIVETQGSAVETYACMTSASLTNVKAWHEVGGFDSQYFIDFVDNDFCKRLQLAGYSILIDRSVILQHQLGDTRSFNFIFFTYKYGEHSPLRTYYMVRNNLYFIRKYKKTLNVPKEYAKVIYIIFNILVFSHNRLKHVKYLLKGWQDYKHNVMGKIN